MVCVDVYANHLAGRMMTACRHFTGSQYVTGRIPALNIFCRGLAGPDPYCPRDNILPERCGASLINEWGE